MQITDTLSGQEFRKPIENYAQAYYRSLQCFYISYSRKAKGNLDSSFDLSLEEQKDLKWWISGADYISSRPIIFLSLEILIFLDASLTGYLDKV
jgi:hypothetical protein